MADLEERTLDRYQLKELLGRGGMADVYVAYDPRFQRRVAVKVFKREDEALLRRFVREARMMASLSHPHLVPVFDTGSSRLERDNVYYIVMPLMTGGTLRLQIKKRGALPLEQCCIYMRELAGVLDYVHARGIIHRDIKSSNVLLDREGRSYLADFGIAHSDAESTLLTTTGDVLGTVGYIAPELLQAHGRANELSDLYALGVLLYEMVTGHLPFTAETPIAVITMQINDPPPSPRQFVPDLSPQIERVLLKGLEKRPERRYLSASELAEAFCRAVAESDTPPPARSIPPTIYSASTQPTPPAQLAAAQPPVYPTPDMHRPKKRLPVIPIIILLLAVIGATVFMVVERPALPGNPFASAPTSSVASTSTPDIAATATSSVAATAVAGPVLYSDPLTNANSQNVRNARWAGGDDCVFTSQGYAVTTPATNTWVGCWETEINFDDFAAQVDMTMQKGYSGGFLIRASSSGWYRFDLTSQGGYRIFIYNGSTSPQLGLGSSPAIKTGSGATNRLLVIARKNVMSFYVNGVYLTAIADNHYTTGWLGFSASSSSDTGETVVFRNLSVHTLVQ